MKKIDLGQAITIIANVGVIAGLAFLAYEISQNTAQMRNEAAYSINESLERINAAQYSDPDLTGLLLRGEQDLGSLDAVELAQFTRYQFTRLNLCEYMLGLEREGLSDVHIRYIEFIVEEFNTKLGLAEWIEMYEHTYGGSEEFLKRLLGSRVDAP